MVVRFGVTWPDDALEDLRPELVRRDRAELLVRHLDRQLEGPPVPDVDDLAARASVGSVPPAPTRSRATSSTGPLRRREADALQAAARERVQPLERERQVRARLSAATAWISSTMIVRARRRNFRLPSAVSRM
jgi:hypothetical protein